MSINCLTLRAHQHQLTARRSGLSTVPALPLPSKSNLRTRTPETPSHTGGLSSAAREKLAERLKARNQPTNLVSGQGITVKADTREMRQPEGPGGLGEFARRGNRGRFADEERRRVEEEERRRGNGNGRDADRDRDRNGGGPGNNTQGDWRNKAKSWDEAPTPRMGSTSRPYDGGSARVPNRGWDETPRSSRNPQSSTSSSRPNPSSSRQWDATPKSVRGRNVDMDSPEPDGEEGMLLDGREWEEEQVRLDRDWYSTYDEGAVVRLPTILRMGLERR